VTRARTAKRILIVEDDPSIRELLKRALGLHYTVVVADDGLSALVLAKKMRPDLFIFDVMLPGKDGLALAQQLKEDAALGKVPVIFITARDGAADIVKGIQSGAKHYITKPFSVLDVTQKVQKILGD